MVEICHLFLLHVKKKFYQMNMIGFVDLHSKKSPQNSHNMSQHFKEMMYLNLLKDKAYTSKVLNYLDKNKSIGFAMPSMVHIGHPTLGQCLVY